MRVILGKVLFLVLSLAIGAAAGCGGSGVHTGISVHGKLLQNNQPAQVDIVGKQLPPGETGRMKVSMYPVKSEKDPIVNEDGATLEPGVEMAAVEADGRFSFATTSGAKGGKYRFVITHIDPSTGQDLLKGAFNEFNSKITRDISPDQEIVIDLSKPAG